MLSEKLETELTDIEQVQIRALPWALAHGVFNTIFSLWTFGGSLFLLFLHELGLPKGYIGALLSLFPFCGIIALWFAPMAARIGWNRVFITCYGSRKLVMALLLLLPWIINTAGDTAGLWWLVGVLVIFAILRALAETAYYPWSQEFVPNAIRGKFTGMSQLLGTAAAGIALFVAGNFIGTGTGLPRYLILLAIGCVSGIIGVICMTRIPGGAPRVANESNPTHLDEMKTVLKDKNFLAYLGGMSGITIGTMLMISFLPLYLKEYLGISSGVVVSLDAAVMIGSALSSLAWGWAADRVGSRPVLMTSLAIGLLVPLGWLLLPRHISGLIFWCITLYFLYGVATGGILVGSSRLLFNSVIPSDRSTAYTAVYYSCMGVTGGIAPLIAGGILSAFAIILPLSNAFNAYHVVFIISLLLFLLGWWLYGMVSPDGKYRTREIISKMFLNFNKQKK